MPGMWSMKINISARPRKKSTPRPPLGRHPPQQPGLALVEAQQKIGKAEDGTGALVATPADGLRQCVIGAMREGNHAARSARASKPWHRRFRPRRDQVQVRLSKVRAVRPALVPPLAAPNARFPTSRAHDLSPNRSPYAVSNIGQRGRGRRQSSDRARLPDKRAEGLRDWRLWS